MMTVRQVAKNLSHRGIEKFVESVWQAVARDAHRHGQNVEDYLNERGVRGDFRRATNIRALVQQNPDGTEEVNEASVDLLLSCLRRLKLSVDQLIADDLRSHPWDLFCAGDALQVVLGTKLVDGHDLRQYVISQRDNAAKNQLVDFLREGQGLEFRTSEECLSIETSPEEAEAALREMQSRRDIGMIACFASLVVNPLAIPVARAILQNARLKKSPAWFEWPVPPETLGFAAPKNPLIFRQSERGSGVRLKTPVCVGEELRTWFPRVSRTEMLRRFRNGDAGPFDDAGLLMLDASCRPMLCLVAGHGGCGTLAALHALLDEETISRELAASHQGGSILGAGRIMQAIEVRCTKRTRRDEVDDLEFGRNDWCAHTLRPPGYAPRAATAAHAAATPR